MKKMVDCPNWKEYQSLSGWVMFCSAGAYGKKMTGEEAKSCSCTEIQRTKCKKVMETNVGFGLVPEIIEVALVVENHPERVLALLTRR